MAYSTVTSKGQVTIPKSLRKRMGIEEGSKLLFVDDGDRILVYKISSDLENIYGAVKHEGPPLDFRKVREQVAQEMAKDAADKQGKARPKAASARLKKDTKSAPKKSKARK